MRRLIRYFSGLSLTQQLGFLILSTVTITASLFFLFIASNVDRFVRLQMYSMLDRSQQMVKANIDNGIDAPSMFGAVDPAIVNLVYDQRNGELSISDEGSLNVQNLRENLVILLRTETSTSARHIEVSGYLVSISRVDDHQAIASVLVGNTQSQFKDSLAGLFNLILLVISLLFMFLILWVGTIIHPLNQIRAYIDKLRRGEDANLVINRKDEIGELANELVQMRKELEEQEQLKQEMIQNISHDLKTPIATIKSYGESIKDGIYPYDTLEKSVDVIIENADRLEKKVHSLLMLNRLDYLASEGKDPGEVALYPVVEKAILASRQIRPEIALQLHGDDVLWPGSEESWRVVFENLIDNALRYAISWIDIRLSPDEIVVANDGPAIDESLMPYLFQAFEKGKGGQFGLGLSIVRRVVNGYGCHVRAENTADGVKFVIFRNRSNKRRIRRLEKEKKTNGNTTH